MSKTGDRLILRPEQQDSPISFQLAGPLPEKSQKQLLLAAQSASLEELGYYYVVYVEVSLHEHSGLVDGSSVLAYGDGLVSRVNLDHDNLLVRPLSHPDLLQSSGRETVLY